MSDHDGEFFASERLTDAEITDLVRGTLDYFAQTPSALAGHRELQRVMDDAHMVKGPAEHGDDDHSLRGVARNAELRMRAVLAMFRHKGKPSYRSMRKVSRELGITVPAVWALVKEAFSESLFSVQVHLPEDLTEAIRLELALQEKFGLQRVLLVPSMPNMLDDVDPLQRRAIHSEVTRAMVRRAAEHLDSLVADAADVQDTKGRPAPFLVGVAWGRTLHLLAEYLLSTKRPPHCPPAMEVVPVIGITSTLNTLPVEANVVAMDIARAFGALSGQLPCPAFHPALEIAIATQARQVRHMLAKLRRCNVVITGMGPIVEDADEDDIRLSNEREMNERLYNGARAAGAVGEICYWCFDAEGKPVTRTPYRSVGLGYEGLRDIARDTERQVILICGGDKRRFLPLRAALKARLASVLVSDVWTARYLMDEL